MNPNPADAIILLLIALIIYYMMYPRSNMSLSKLKLTSDE